MIDKKEHCRLLTALRRWETKHIPLSTPKISLDLILLCCLHEAGIPVKRIIHELGHSADRIRETLKELEIDGWIMTRANPCDSRAKIAYVTEKARSLMLEHARVMQLWNEAGSKRSETTFTPIGNDPTSAKDY